jgi:hypothetical protein
MDGSSSVIQLRLCRLKKGFEHEHDNDNEHDLGKRQVSAYRVETLGCFCPEGSAAKRAAMDLSQRLLTWIPSCMNLVPFLRPEVAKEA